MKRKEFALSNVLTDGKTWSFARIDKGKSQMQINCNKCRGAILSTESLDAAVKQLKDLGGNFDGTFFWCPLCWTEERLVQTVRMLHTMIANHREAKRDGGIEIDRPMSDAVVSAYSSYVQARKR